MARKPSNVCKRGHDKPLGGDCPECNRLRCLRWRDDNLEYARERALEYHREHRDDHNAKMRDYARATRPERSAKQKEWRTNHKDHLTVYFRERYRNIPEVRSQQADYKRKWKIANRDIWRERNNVHKNRRRARLRGLSEHHTLAEWRAIVESQNGRCAYCGVEAGLDRDHIIPLSRGGGDTISNIQGLCRPCNQRKSARIEGDP